VPLPQIQPSCQSDSSTGQIDCGKLGDFSSLDVPGQRQSELLISPLYGWIARWVPYLGCAQYSSHSDIVVQTSDTTWQAYNDYGGNSLYSGNPVGRAYKVSYNRPVNPSQPHWDFFVHEYPIVRFLEANGYDVTYSLRKIRTVTAR